MDSSPDEDSHVRGASSTCDKKNKTDMYILGGVCLMATGLVTAVIIIDKVQHVPVPSKGEINTKCFAAWLGVITAVWCFGCHPVAMKISTKCDGLDCMVFQTYFSFTVALVAMVIWVPASGGKDFTMTWASYSMGALFAGIWITLGITCYLAIHFVGLAVAQVIWIGVNIVVSVLFGFCFFSNKPASWAGVVGAIALMVVGVVLAGLASEFSVSKDDASETDTDGMELSSLEMPPLGPLTAKLGSAKVGERDVDEIEYSTVDSAVLGQKKAVLGPSKMGQRGADETSCFTEFSKAPSARYGVVLGYVLAVVAGCLCAGLLFGPVCFRQGCPAIGVAAYTKESETAISIVFLPSVTLGLITVHPVMFLLYWGPSMVRGTYPDFRLKDASAPGIMAGCLWGLGYYCLMFMEMYLGQIVGTPCVQVAICFAGPWGFFYFREFQGTKSAVSFALSTACILGGAVLIALYGG